MRMRKAFEAYFDDYDFVNIYMSKNFFNGQSNSFHLKDTRNRIIPLMILSMCELYNGYMHYECKLNGMIQIGEEYSLFEEHCQQTICQYSHIVKTSRFNNEFVYTKDDLGISYSKENTTFKLWAPTAHSIILCLTHHQKQYKFDMKKDTNGVFSYCCQEDCLHDPYYFLVRVNGQWNQTIDPYSWFSGPNSSYSVVESIELLNLPKKISCSKMSSNCDAIIYETSIRDMTSMPDLDLRYTKKFAGFYEENELSRKKEYGFSYLKTLGITHVQLMPVFDFGSVDETFPNIYYNWGYDPVSYRALEGSYARDPKDAKQRVLDFAQLVQHCHQADIRVNLDLVFNHVYNRENFVLEKLVPNYYFLMNQQGEFSNGSYCGNDIDSQPPMSRKYLVDTCKKIVEYYDVDGFRFDLMGILDINVMNEIASTCKKIKPDFMIYGEGWNMPSFVPEELRASQNNQAKMPNIGHFSDGFRNTVRGSNSSLDQKGFASGDCSFIYSMMDRMSASGNSYNSPEKVINYVECHDNHTLWDKNHFCCHDESHEIRAKRQILATAMVLLAQGVPFIHSGQEFGRTKQNLGNTYNSSDSINQLSYARKDAFSDMVEQVKALIQIRKNHPCFHLSTTTKTRNQVEFETIEDCVLVYRCYDQDDSTISFFNPTSRYFQYYLNSRVEVLFDNGNCNEKSTEHIEIAPYSVVVAQYMEKG